MRIFDVAKTVEPPTASSAFACSAEQYCPRCCRRRARTFAPFLDNHMPVRGIRICEAADGAVVHTNSRDAINKTAFQQ